MLGDPGFRELYSLPLAAPVLQGLCRAGYTTVGEVAGMNAARIVSACGVNRDSASTVLRLVQRYHRMQLDADHLIRLPTAYELLHIADQTDRIGQSFIPDSVVTLSKSFDNMLGAGFPIQRLTELCGEPGVGKTQFSIQTCLTVQIPRWFGGLEGEAIFIDTEGNFVPRRAQQMAESLVKHCRQHLLLEGDQLPTDTERNNLCPSVDQLLSGLHYIRVTDHLQLLSACQRLAQFCEQHPKVRLVVVDSIALPFRYDFDDIPMRNRLLGNIAQCLLSLAGQQKAAVILTNQITTRLGDQRSQLQTNSIHSDNQLVPALGESWGHMCSIRVFLTRISDQCRHARLLKHPGRPFGTATYRITVAQDQFLEISCILEEDVLRHAVFMTHATGGIRDCVP